MLHRKRWPRGTSVPSKTLEGGSRTNRFRRLFAKLLGAGVLVLVGLFDFYAWKHLVYGEFSFGLWVGFGMMGLLSIAVTFFGLVVAGILLLS
jgi:hypothetical protein